MGDNRRARPLGLFPQLLSTYLPEQLVFKSRLSDSEVNDGDFDADLREVVRVGHLGCHVKSEVLVVVDVAVSETNEETATLKK